MQCAATPIAETGTGARLTCLTTLDTAARTPAPVRAAGSQGEAAAKKGTRSVDGPQTQTKALSKQPQKLAVAAKKAVKPAVKAAAGIAHDGVVDFPDLLGKAGGKRAKSKGKGKALQMSQGKDVTDRQGDRKQNRVSPAMPKLSGKVVKKKKLEGRVSD